MIDRKRYCLDTSGLSNPLDSMPEDIPFYRPIWEIIQNKIRSGLFAVNTEIYEELCRLPGNIGTCINSNKDNLVLEIGGGWNWNRYLEIFEEMRERHRGVISEYNGNIKRTVGINDVSIVALAKCLQLPLISMESASYQNTDKRVRIPGLCRLETVDHWTFNDLLTKG